MPFPTAMRPGSKPSSSAPPSYRPPKKKPGEVDEKGHAAAPLRQSGPPAQNANRLTGPPIQMGAGTGSMFANGRPGGRSPAPFGAAPATPNYPRTSGMRPGGQMQGNPPASPNYPQVRVGPTSAHGQPQGPHPRGNPTATMFADGGFGMPPAIGGAPDDDDSQQGTPVGGEDDMGDAGAQGPQGSPDMPVIRPEAVGYHDEARSCAGGDSGPACMYFGQDGQCAVLKMTVSGPGACQAYELGGGGGGDQTDMSQGMPTGASMTQNDEGTSGSPSMS